MRPEFVNLSEILYLFPKCKILSLFASIGLIKSSQGWFIGGGQGGGQPHSDHKITFLMLPIYHQAILPPTHPPHPHIPPILPNPSSPHPPSLGIAWRGLSLHECILHTQPGNIAKATNILIQDEKYSTYNWRQIAEGDITLYERFLLPEYEKNRQKTATTILQHND